MLIRNIFNEIDNKFEERISKEYQFIKEVFLDSQIVEEKSIIEKIEKTLFENNVRENNIEEIIHNNTIFKIDEECYFSIRYITHWWEDDKIQLKKSRILFLLKNENEFSNFLKEFRKEIEIDDIKIVFPESKRNNEELKICKDIIQDLLEGNNYTKNIDRNQIENFFENKEVIYSKEINIDEIRLLKDVHSSGYLAIFVSSDEMTINDISEILNDINFYNKSKEQLYAVKQDENYKIPKLRIVAVSQT